jgi:tRNA acetyltransferase TAN1
VRTICQNIADGAQPRNLRYVKRLTPITATDKATPQGLETVAKQVLGPHFHGTDQAGKKVCVISCCQMMQPRCTKIFVNARCTKFAIRTSIRNNKVFQRDELINTIAAAVGPGHKVDLKGYDLLILVEIYKVRYHTWRARFTCVRNKTLAATHTQQNVLGMSVVGPEFEKLKRFNIEELRQPVSSAESEVPDKPEISGEKKVDV